MKWTDIRTGYSCNQQCRFCDQGDARSRVVDADTGAVAATLERLSHRDGVVLAGGEVTLRADLPSLIQTAKSLGYKRVAVQTNGRILASKGAALHLREQGLTDVVLALHAPDAHMHDWLTATPGSFRQAISGARASVAAGLRLRITTVVCRSNMPLLSGMVRVAHELGATSQHFTLCREEGGAAAEARMLVPRFSLAGPAIVAALDLARLLVVDADVVGLPLCFLGNHRATAGDRLDVVQPDRVGAVPGVAPARASRYLAPCAGCRLRPACRGVDAHYADRYGDEELLPQGVPLPAKSDVVRLELFDAAGPLSTRLLRQALVKLRAKGIAQLEMVGDHPDIGIIHKEAERLGFLAPPSSLQG